MTRSYVFLLALLAAVWGSGYLLIKIALEGFEPTTMMTIRLGVSVMVLVGFLAWRRELGAVRRVPRGAYLLGLFNAAIPFTLIAWGEKYVDSGTAAVANAGVPLFVAMLVPWFALGERVVRRRLVGLLLGFGGVALLVGLHPSVTWLFVAGTAAILVATFSYAIGTLYGEQLVAETSGPVLATTAYIGATMVLLPLGIVQAPQQWPGWEPVAAVLFLALVGTTCGALLWYALLSRYGSSRAALVSYLVPGVALVYGAILLHESLGPGKIGGFALSVVGVILASGSPRRVRRGLDTSPAAGDDPDSPRPVRAQSASSTESAV